MTLPTTLPFAGTLAEVLDGTLSRDPGAAAHVFLSTRSSEPRTATFADWSAQSRALAERLASDVQPGDPVVIASPSCPEFLPALFACFRLGAAAVPLYPPRPGSEAEGAAWIARVAGLSGARIVLAPAAVAAVLTQQGIGTGDSPLRVVTMGFDAASPAGSPAWIPRRVAPDSTALILFTSGSTGAPKGVVLTHRNLCTNIGEFASGHGLGPADRMVTWLPNCHIAGLYTRLVGVFSGAATVEFPAALFLEQPAFWLDAISRYGGRISAAPNFAYDLVGALPDSALDGISLQHWSLAISGGEMVRPTTVRRLMDRLARCGFAARAFTPYYGLTETLCTTLRQSDSLEVLRLDRAALASHRVVPVVDAGADAVELVSNGRPLGTVRVCIADPVTRRPLAEGQVGEVWAGGDGITPGYLNQEALNAEVVRAGLDSSEPGRWFRTGDLGFQHNGELFITGRLKELIIVRGKNLYPADLERCVSGGLAGLPVGECAAFAHESAEGEAVAIALELARGVAIDAVSPAEIRSRVAAALIRGCGVGCSAVVLLPHGGLPRTATAKVQRSRCRERLQTGAWTPISVEVDSTDSIGTEAANAATTAPDSSTVSRLKRVVAGVVGRPAASVNAALGLAELGVDSLGAVRLMTAIESEFGRGVGIGTLLSARSLSHLGDTLDRILALGAAAEESEPVDYRAELEAVRTLCAGLDRSRKAQAIPARRLFLTGATGFLGSYLLRDLMRVEGTTVCCLVRGESASVARTRLLRKLGEIPGWNAAWNERIRVECGSLEDSHLGLGEAGLLQLAGSIDAVIHNGASVNFVAPYSFLRAVNVTSNLGVLRLAVAGGGLPVHYVSTTAVFNGPGRDRLDRIRETDSLESADELFSGYAQTKWVSESLWREAAVLGLPVTVHRPGLVTGDQLTGAWHTDDFLCRFLKGCLQLGRFPDLAVEVDMIPVDIVSAAMAAAVTNLGTPAPAYHWTHPAPARMAEIAGWFRSAGWNASVEPVAEWMKALRSLDSDNALFPLTPFLLQRVGAERETLFEFFGRRRLKLSRENAAGLMERSGIHCPDPIQGLMPLYAGHLVGSGFLPSPQSAAQNSR